MKLDTQQLKNAIVNFIVPVICLVASALLFFLVIYPGLSQVPILKQDLESKKTLEASLKKKLTNLNSLLDFKSAVDENADLVSQALVSEPLVPELLTQVDTISRDAGLYVSRMSYSFSDVPTSAAGEAVPTTQTYKDVVVSLGAEGDYNQLVSFLSIIEQASRLVNVLDFRYAVQEDENGSSLGMTAILTSPYLNVVSTAVTDDPITFEIGAKEFTDLIGKVKALKHYDLEVAFTDLTEFEETVESTPSDQITTEESTDL